MRYADPVAQAEIDRLLLAQAERDEKVRESEIVDAEVVES